VTETATKEARPEVDAQAQAAAWAEHERLQITARRMAGHILASFALLGVSSSYMIRVAGEMVLDCLSDIAARDKAQAEDAINGMARELVHALDELQSSQEAGANGTQAGE
jgi:hypothetical protein